MVKTMKSILLMIVVLLAPLSSAASQTAAEWRDSLVTLNKLIDRYPRSVDLRLRKAAVNIELNQWEYAIEEYGHVLSLEPDNLSAHYFRAYANIHRRQYALAKSDYEAILQLVPRHLEARLGLARVNELLGRKSDARDELNLLVEQFPDSAICYAARATFESQQQQYAVALYDWDEAIRLAPRNTDFVVTKVSLLLTLNRKSEAAEELKKALQRGIPRGVLQEWIAKCRQ